MNIKQKIFANVLIMLIVLSTKVLANIQTTENFSMVDGLPSNVVFDIFEDSRGLVWLATDAGLYEFTGEDIKFRKALTKLQGERINSICEDADGNLWFSSLGLGLSKFDGDRLSIIQFDSLKNEREIYYLQTIGSSNKLMLGTSDGLYEYNIDESSLTAKNTTYPKAIFKIRSVDSQLITSSECQKENFIYHIKFGDYLKNDSEEIPIVSLGIQNDLDKLKKVLGGEKTFRLNLSKENSVIADVIEQEENAILSYYLLRYYENGVEKRKVLKLQDNSFVDFSAVNKLDNYFINTIFLRKGQNDLWFGTQNCGLVKVENSFFKYIHTGFNGFKNPESQDLVSDFYGNILVSNKNELIIVNDLQIKKRIVAKDFYAKCAGEVENLKDFSLYRLQIDKEGLVWISSSKGFFTFNTSNYQLQFVGITPASEFIFTQDGELLSFWDNTLSFNKKDGKCEEKPSYSFEQSSTIEISKMRNQGDIIWIATRQKGILKFHENQFSIYNRNNSGFHNVINDLLIVDNSTLIVAGNNGLIYKLNITDTDLKVIDTIGNEDGVVGTAIQGFQLLDDNSLWCGTNTGVHRFDYNSWEQDSILQFRFWNLNDGYYDQNGERSIVDADQNIWVQTRSRLLKIDTKRFSDQDHLKTRISLRTILVHNEEWMPKKEEVNRWTNTPIEPVAFKYFENDLTFNFGMDFCQNISNVRYRYLLEGYDKTWSDWTTDTKAMYSHLPGGDYVLRIEGRQLSDLEIIPFSFTIQVKIRWWKTWWFIILASLLLILLILLIGNTYVRIVRRKEKERTKQFNRVIALKMKSLQNQLDPHFIFNALNSIQSHILDENTENALDYLSDFSMVLRKNINNANKDFISLADEINYLQHYLKLEQMRFSDKFAYKINVDNSIKPHKYLLPPMLIQPFIENAIKYGLSGSKEKGQLTLSFEAESDGYLKCTIKDNGIGRQKSKGFHQDSNISNHHKTLQITRDRIKLLNKVLDNGRVYSYSIEDLFDDSEFPCGTKVEIGFPKASRVIVNNH